MAEENRTLQMGHREFLACDYALVNPMQLESNQWMDLPSSVLKPAGLDMPVGMLPRLVDLSALNEDARIALLTRSDTWQRLNKLPLFSALLSSSRDFGTVHKHLRTQMVLRRERRYWLRLHDPRVLACLERVLTDAQLRRLFGPINTWTWFEPFRAEWRLRSKPAKPQGIEPYQLDAMQWSTLKRLPLLNRCLRRLSRDGGTVEGYQSVAARIDGSLGNAAELGLGDRDDACLYALNIERHGPAWLTLPHVRAAINDAQLGEQSLVRALADVEPAASPRTLDTTNAIRSYS